ncbi:MAG TPA: dephospho-CoA kinase [Planctomycetota bacterium]|nr:dephospho-CoA kinase [Planctomycetota bacterium]
MIVGITGGVGAGKSTVTRILEALGAETVDADALAHEALETRAVREALVHWLGDSIMTPDGNVNRKGLAERVFSHPEDLKRLEALVHPQVLARITRKVEEHRTSEKARGGSPGETAESILVLDIPLLESTPLKDLCDHVIYVDATAEARRRRVRERGWEEGELERREGLQTALEDKKGMSDAVIDNSGLLAETRGQVEALYSRWTGKRIQTAGE